jgi:ferric iron reductase protein FhuF
VNDVDPEEAGLAALEAAARVGPFFVLRPDPSDDGWMPFAAFAADVDRVAAAVDDARRRMAVAAGTSADSFEPRATASIWHLGIAARLVSPALGAAVLARWVPRLDNLLWSPETATGPDGLAIRAADIEGTPVADAAGAAAAIEAGVVGTAIRPITESVSALAAVSANVLWGNVWSAFAGAATVLAAGRPTAGRAAVDVVRMLVATTPHTLAGGYDSAGRFRRDTCCLYYRLPRGGLCGDCVLHRVPQAAVRSLDNSLVEAGAGRYP